MAVGEYRVGKRGPALKLYPSAIFLAAFMLLGEMAALRALLTESDSELLKGLTTISLVCGFVFVVMRLAVELLISGGATASEEMRKRQNRLLIGTEILIAILAYLMLSVNT